MNKTKKSILHHNKAGKERKQSKMYYVGFEFTIDTPLLNIKIIGPICEYYHLGEFISINFSHKLEPDIPIHYSFEAEKGYISGDFTMCKDSDKQYTVTVHTADVIRKK